MELSTLIRLFLSATLLILMWIGYMWPLYLLVTLGVLSIELGTLKRYLAVLKLRRILRKE